MASRYNECPCDNKLPYSKCCGRFHSGASPETALELMRSRYSAYALDLVEYVMRTTHPECAQFLVNRERWSEELHRFSRGTRFLYLTIIEFTAGEETAYVSFTAHLEQDGKDATFTERSTFLKVDGHWLYRLGDIRSEACAPAEN